MGNYFVHIFVLNSLLYSITENTEKTETKTLHTERNNIYYFYFAHNNLKNNK